MTAGSTRRREGATASVTVAILVGIMFLFGRCCSSPLSAESPSWKRARCTSPSRPLGADLVALIEAVPRGEGKLEVGWEQGAHLGDRPTGLLGVARGRRGEAGRRATRRVGWVHGGGGGDGFRSGKDGEAGPAVADEDAEECVGGVRAAIHGLSMRLSAED